MGYAHTWGESRVFYRESDSQAVRSLPATWTDVEEPNPFIAVGKGRSYFRVDDLLTLAGFLHELGQGRRCK